MVVAVDAWVNGESAEKTGDGFQFRLVLLDDRGSLVSHPQGLDRIGTLQIDLLNPGIHAAAAVVGVMVGGSDRATEGDARA